MNNRKESHKRLAPEELRDLLAALGLLKLTYSIKPKKSELIINSNCWKDLRSMCTEMTSKMQMLYEDIIASQGQLLPEKRIYVFGDDENVDMDWVIAVANYITLEFIKYSYRRRVPSVGRCSENDPVYKH